MDKGLYKWVSRICFGVLLFFMIAAGAAFSASGAPDAPKTLQAVESTRTNVYLIWHSPEQRTDITAYQVYRGTERIGETKDTAFAVGGLSPDTTYTFHVKAKNAAGLESDASNIVSVTTKPAELPKPAIGKHPRLYVSSQGDLDLIRAKRSGTNGMKVWQKIVQSSDAAQVSDAVLPTPAGSVTNYNAAVRTTIENTAFRYLLDGDPVIGRKAVDMALQFLTTVRFPTGNYDEHLASGDTLHMAAIVYDWSYGLLSEQEKAAFITQMERVALTQELGYPPVKQGAVVSHAGGQALMRNLLAAGIAVYDEKSEMYDVTATRFFNEFVPARNFVYMAGMHHQGTYYTWQRFEGEIYASLLFAGLGYDIFNQEQSLIPYRTLYQRRPDGQLMRDGDVVKTRATHGTYWEYPNIYMLTEARYPDPYTQYEVMLQLQPDNTNPGHPTPLMQLLFGKPDEAGAAPDTLPLTRYFGFPQGTMIARTGWQMDADMGSTHSSPAVIAEMKIGAFNFGNHSHLDAGQFQLYYKGALAIDSGVYQGLDANGNMNDYGSPHDVNYLKKSIAHNTILVRDPSETASGTVNDGGQRYPNNRQEPKTLDDLLNKGYQSGEVLAHQFGPDPVTPDFSYLKGDITRAYTSKVDQVERSFVFLNLKNTDHPGALIVLDRVRSANPAFKKTWLLHSVEEPVIEGNMTTVTRTEKDYNGKLVNSTLLPEVSNLQIAKVGGPGHEFEVGGTNYPSIVQGNGNSSDESGAWRIEVSPVQAAQEDLFLNVMQVMDDKDGPTPLQVKRIQSAELVGAQILDRAVLFSATGGKLDAASFQLIGTDPQVNILVTDLKAGYWRAVKSGETAVWEMEVTEEGGTLYFTGSAGEYTLTRSDIRTLPEPAPVTTAMPEYPAADIKVEVDGKQLAFSLPPEFSGTTLAVPYQMLLAQMGAEYDYDETAGVITAVREGITLSMTLGQTDALVNGQNAVLPVAPYVKNGRLYVPLAWVVEQLGGIGTWDASTQTYLIVSEIPEEPDTPWMKLDIQGVTSSVNDPILEGYTIDGQIVAIDRWAAEGDGQWIQYDLGEEQLLGAVGIAWHMGDQRNWVFDVQISNDGINWNEMITRKQTDGSTLEVQAHPFRFSSARYLRIVGHGNTWPSAWNSITEVEVYTPQFIELEKLAIERVTSSLNDPVLEGYTVDGQIIAIDRWAAEGDGQWISYDLGSEQQVGAVGIAWYMGDSRNWVFDVQVSSDGTEWAEVITRKESSGKTLEVEKHDLPEGTTARYVKIIGHGNTYPSPWNSITEVEIYRSEPVILQRLPVPVERVQSVLNDPVMEGWTVDRQIVEADRWAAEGDGTWIQYDLDAVRPVGGVGIAWYAGERRNWVFDVQVSMDGSEWTEVLTRVHSSGTTTEAELYSFPLMEARYVRIIGHGNTYPSTWTSITEVEIYTGLQTSNRTQVTIDGLEQNIGQSSYVYTLALENVTSSVYAQAISFRYDPEVWGYVSAATAAPGWTMVSAEVKAPGQLELVMASRGSAHAISTGSSVANIILSALPTTEPRSGQLEVTQAVTADHHGVERYAAGSVKPVSVVPPAVVAGAREELLQPALLLADEASEAVEDNVTQVIAEADAYVRSGAYGATNYGTTSDVVLKNGTGTANREGYMKFNLGLAPSAIQTVTLHVYGAVTENGVTDSRELQILGVEDDSWIETDLVGDNRPAFGELLSSAILTPQYQWHSIDITSFVMGQQDPLISLGLRASGPIAEQRIRSKDSAGNKPYLRIVEGEPLPEEPDPIPVPPDWNAGTLTEANLTSQTVTLYWSGASHASGVAGYKVYMNGTEIAQVGPEKNEFQVTDLIAGTTYRFKVEAGSTAGLWSTTGPSAVVVTPGQPPASLTFTVVEDSYVRGLDYANTNYGRNSDVWLNSGGNTANREGYLKFDLRGVSTFIQSAKLYIYARIEDQNVTDTRIVEILGVEDDTWTELQLLGANRPPFAGSSLSSTAVDRDYGWHEMDVTSFARSQADRIISLGVRATGTPSTIKFNSKDHPSGNHPYLEVELSDTDPAISEPPVWSGAALTASGTTRSGVSLNWDAAVHPAGVAAYRVYGNGELIAEVAGDATSHVLAGLTADTSYSFKIEASNAEGLWSTTGPQTTVVTLAPVSGIALDKSILQLHKGAAELLTALVTPLNSNQAVLWSSSDPSVAAVDEHGRVTGLKAGNAVITASTVEGAFTSTSEIEVVVNYDLNGDGRLWVGDLGIAANYYGMKAGDPEWNAASLADVNEDNIVNELDFIEVEGRWNPGSDPDPDPDPVDTVPGIIEISAPSTVDRLSTFTVALEGKDAVKLYALHANLEFDPSMVEFVGGVIADGFANGQPVLFSASAEDGKLELIASQTGQNQMNGNADIAYLTFAAKRDLGQTAIVLKQTTTVADIDADATGKIYPMEQDQILQVSIVNPVSEDVNLDGVINLLDLVKVALQYNKAVTADNRYADINGDQTIDIMDLSRVAAKIIIAL